jgi:transketolase
MALPNANRIVSSKSFGGIDMRNGISETLTSLAERDASLMLIVADLGGFKSFRDRFPDRFINVGVAEQNSIGIAAGLASEGKRVFVYGVAGFTLYRAFEQIKFSIGYWNQKVCIIGSGFGWRFHQIGRGHHAVDDIALMRLVPNMRILTPFDEERLPILLSSEPNGPLYLRLGDGIQGKSLAVTSRADITEVSVLALGEMAKHCSAAASNLRSEGIDIRINPVEDLRIGSIDRMLRDLGTVKKRIVVEDHIALGGLGSIIRDLGYPVDRHLCLPLNVEHITKTLDELIEYYGFDTSALQNAFDPRLWEDWCA